MHSSIGTGSLAYVIGSKVMDMRISSQEETKDAEVQTVHISEANSDTKDKSYTCLEESSSDYCDLVHVRKSTVGGAYDSSSYPPSPDPCDCSSPITYGPHDSDYACDSFLDFPALPFTDLFEDKHKNDGDAVRLHEHTNSTRRGLRYEDDHMHSFQINNNADLIEESNSFSSNDVSLHANCNGETILPDVRESPRSNNLEFRSPKHKIRISDVPDIPATSANGDRASEWLWTLHRIGKHVNCFALSFWNYVNYHILPFAGAKLKLLLPTSG